MLMLDGEVDISPRLDLPRKYQAMPPQPPPIVSHLNQIKIGADVSEMDEHDQESGGVERTCRHRNHFSLNTADVTELYLLIPAIEPLFPGQENLSIS